MSWRVELTGIAEASFDALSNRAAAWLENSMRLLATAPWLGHVYDPPYPSATPPLPLRVLHVGNYGIYYTVDADREIVTVRFIEDQRMDPDARFSNRLGW